MPRQPHRDGPDAVVHVTGRVNWRVWHLTTPGAFALFIRVLDRLLDEFCVDLIGFVLMSNHYHLVLRSPDEPDYRRLTSRRVASRHTRRYPKKNFKSSVIAQFMHKLTLTLSKEIQESLGISGHLWGGVYDKRWVHDAVGLVARVAYDHRNPVRQGMTGKPDDYRWSSAAAWGQGDLTAPIRLLRRESLPFDLRTSEFRDWLLRYQDGERLDDVLEVFRKTRLRWDSPAGRDRMRELLAEAGLEPGAICGTAAANRRA